MLTPENRVAEFPSLETMTYLNTAAEGLPPQAGLAALERYWEDKSRGMSGRDAMFAEYEACRESTARLFGVHGDEVSFCSCSSEAFNLLASAVDLQSDDEVVITDLEYPSGATPWMGASSQPAIHLWKHKGGVLELGDLQLLLSEKTRLVQVSLVSFLTGYRVDWKPLRDIVRSMAPNAVLSVDVTQAAGRIELDCMDADCIIASSYKWLLGIHGSCVVVVPGASAEKLTTRVGGWFHLIDGFESDRFERYETESGAKSFSVGMPAFPSIYALRAGIDYVARIGVAEIAAHADLIVARVHEGLAELGIRPMSPNGGSGIVAFQHPRDAEIGAALLQENIHVMNHAGRLRIAVHGYNQMSDADEMLKALATLI
jgi:selenocysteine lyase/cysteine desulfurase